MEPRRGSSFEVVHHLHRNRPFNPYTYNISSARARKASDRGVAANSNPNHHHHHHRLALVSSARLFRCGLFHFSVIAWTAPGPAPRFRSVTRILLIFGHTRVRHSRSTRIIHERVRSHSRALKDPPCLIRYSKRFGYSEGRLLALLSFFFLTVLCFSSFGTRFTRRYSTWLYYEIS